jgi:hypothetical protein
MDCGNGCVDLKNDLANCGVCGIFCTMGTNPRCVDGACQDTTCMGIGRTYCNDGGCHTNDSFLHDPLNCGGCGVACQTNQVCAAGMCQTYFPSPFCNSCPCAACGPGTKCCVAAGTAICVTGTNCPG